MWTSQGDGCLRRSTLSASAMTVERSESITSTGPVSDSPTYDSHASGYVSIRYLVETSKGLATEPASDAEIKPGDSYHAHSSSSNAVAIGGSRRSLSP